MEVISDKPTRKFLSAITLWRDKAFRGLKRGPVITRQRDAVSGWFFIKLKITDPNTGDWIDYRTTVYVKTSRTKELGNDYIFICPANLS